MTHGNQQSSKLFAGLVCIQDVCLHNISLEIGALWAHGNRGSEHAAASCLTVFWCFLIGWIFWNSKMNQNDSWCTNDDFQEIENQQKSHHAAQFLKICYVWVISPQFWTQGPERFALLPARPRESRQSTAKASPRDVNLGLFGAALGWFLQGSMPIHAYNAP